MAGQGSKLGVLIVGGNGFLGSHLARSLRKQARVITTYLKNRVPIEGVLSLPIDLRDSNGMKRILNANKPDVVIFLGGPEDSAWVDAHAKIAEKVFSAGASDVLHLSEMISARFIYVSNTSVFDGTRGNYKETDNVSPMTLLGKLKAGGENAVRSRATNGVVLRLSPLVGSAHPWRPSQFDRLRAALQAETPLEFSDEEYHSWLTVSDAVAGITAAVHRAPKGATLHVGGLTRMTSFELAKLYAKSHGFSETFVKAKKKVITKGMIILPEGEKFDFSLNSTEMMRATDFSPSSIEDRIVSEFLP